MAVDEETRSRSSAPTVRLLGHGDGPSLTALCRRDPIAHVFVAGRLERAGSPDPAALGGSVLGCFQGRTLVAAYWVGANIMPIEATPITNAAIAPVLVSVPRRSTSLIGTSDQVLDLAARMGAWGEPLWSRAVQPLLSLTGPPAIEPDPLVQPGTRADAEVIFRASVAMFEEEVGFSPIADGEAPYRSRVAQLIRDGETFARFAELEDSWPALGRRQVAFKADIAVRSRDASQIQGVWVHPALRGRGLAAPALAQVVQHARARFGPVVSLYVNDFNERARRTYARVGFEQVGTFATVMY